MRIQHNITAMNAYRSYNNNTRSLSKNLEKLSSGYRINRAGDDAAGLAISEKMRAQITGLNAASKNVKDGISLVQTAEGAMQEVQDMLGRMKYLATQSANGTYQNEVDRENLQKEVDSLLDEIDRIADSANFNGQKLLDGSLGGGNGKVTFGGQVQTTKEAATAGSFTVALSSVAISNAMDGDKFSMTISLKDGKSYTVKLTAKQTVASGSTADVLVDENGDVVIALASGGLSDAASVFATQFQKTALGKDFNISASAGSITFQNKVAGSKAPQIGAVDALVKNSAVTGIPLSGTLGEDIKYVLSGSGAVTLFTGTNLDEAVFTVNGKKFVAVDGSLAVGNYELGKDITVLHTSDGAGILKALREKAGVNAKIDNNTLVIQAGDGQGLNLQIGDTSDDFNQMKVLVKDLHVNALNLRGLDISTPNAAKAAVDIVTDAINAVSASRGDLGAIQNRLEHTSNNLSVMTENIQDAESTIRDTDVADEMMKYTKNNILIQSAQAMLAQANQVPQGVLQLLQ